MRKYKYPLIIGALLLSVVAVAMTNAGKQPELNKPEAISNTTEGEGVIYLDKESFKEKVFNYETSQSWKYEGKVPAILDFYADWCGPCKQLSPVLTELQKEYGDKIQIYKINTDKERELASTFGIRSLPTIVFVPLEGEPQAAMGFRPKADLENMVKEILKVEK